MMKISVSVGDLKLKNPTILASGILGSTGASLCRVAKCGAGALVTKSIGVDEREGYVGPNLVKLEHGFLNAMGLPNPSYKNFLPELREAKKGGVPVIASIFGKNREEFAEVAEALAKDADALELNLSCPHAEGYGADIGCDAPLVGDIVRSVKKVADVPVWVKLTLHSDVSLVGRTAIHAGADALVAINTVRATAIDIESGYPLLGNKVGGLSGAAIKPIALRCVYDLYPLGIPIIGAGGVSSWQDAVEFVLAGASAVQIGSAVYDHITIFSGVSKGMAKYLERKKVTLDKIRGSAHGK